jgi:hypothetical protein
LPRGFLESSRGRSCRRGVHYEIGLLASRCAGLRIR